MTDNPQAAHEAAMKELYEFSARPENQRAALAACRVICDLIKKEPTNAV